MPQPEPIMIEYYTIAYKSESNNSSSKNILLFLVFK